LHTTKAILSIAFSLCLLLGAFGCGGKGGDDVPPAEAASETAAQTGDPSGKSVMDYFTLKSNTYYEYESSTHDELSQQSYVSYTGGNRIQRRVSASSMSSTEVIEYKDGALALIFGEPTFYFFESLLDVEPNMSLIILKEPLFEGQTWKPDEYSDVVVTSMETQVATPSGNYSAMEVTTSYTDGRLQREYYAPGVGLVRTEYTTADGSTLDYSLARVSEGAELEVLTDFYNLDGEALERSVSLGTNADLAAIFTNELHKPVAGGEPLLPENVSILDLEVDRSENCVIMNLSSDLGLLGDTEVKTLQALADTLGNFFDVANARPLANTSMYSTANASFGPGDTLAVDLKSANHLVE
jgi:hypothetical protein